MSTPTAEKIDEPSVNKPMAMSAEVSSSDPKPAPGSTRPTTATAKPATGAAKPDKPRSPEERRQRISDSAYYKSERRGFTPGREEQDWYEAEREVDAESPGRLRPEDNTFPSPK